MGRSAPEPIPTISVTSTKWFYTGIPLFLHASIRVVRLRVCKYWLWAGSLRPRTPGRNELAEGCGRRWKGTGRDCGTCAGKEKTPLPYSGGLAAADSGRGGIHNYKLYFFTVFLRLLFGRVCCIYCADEGSITFTYTRSIVVVALKTEREVVYVKSS